MAHIARDREKLLNRVRRIRGQLDAIEKAIVEDRDCGEIMHLLAASRGAVGSLTAHVIEGHIRDYVVDPKGALSRRKAADELVDVLKTYFR